MGWLDHSTNNIILDAVLTDYGRQRLASANSDFKIAKYSLGDDEIDYRLIKKYGRTVGKEKIEKNTPIFEALTNENIALKYKLIGRENNGSSVSTLYLPYLTLNNGSVSLNSGTESQVNLTLKYARGSVVPADLIQTTYTIKVSDRFFTVKPSTGGGSLQAPTLVNPGDPNRVVVYTLSLGNTSTTSTNFGFTIAAKNIDSTTLSIYGKKVTESTREIKSIITVEGQNHGISIDIPVTYTATLGAA